MMSQKMTTQEAFYHNSVETTTANRHAYDKRHFQEISSNNARAQWTLFTHSGVNIPEAMKTLKRSWRFHYKQLRSGKFGNLKLAAMTTQLF